MSDQIGKSVKVRVTPYALRFNHPVDEGSSETGAGITW
jgi:hypothetical protein